MWKIFGLAIFLATSLSVTPSFAQAVEFKCPKPGMVVEFSDGQRTTWLRQEDRICKIQQKRRDGTEILVNWYAPTATLGETVSQTWAEQLKPWDLWPLAVGKKVHVVYDGPGSSVGYSGTWDTTILVEKADKVTTPAGTFDALVITQKQDQIGGRYKSTFRQWYVPAISAHVKFEFSDNNAQNSTAQAVSIKQ